MVQPQMSVATMRTAEQFAGMRKSTKDGRSRLEILWKLGIAFYRGRQYTYYSPSQKRIAQMPVQDDSRPDTKTRIVSNQLKPAANKLVALLSKSRPMFGATAGNGDPNSIKAARLAEAAAEYWWEALDLPRKYRQALLWARVAGQGYWLITWDPYAGKPYSYLCHPEDQTPVPSETAPHFAAELQQAGVDPQMFTRTSYDGDIDISVVNPLNVLIDPTVEQFEDARWCIIDKHLSPEEVKTRWGRTVDPDNVIVDADLGAQNTDLDGNNKTVVVVSWLYHRPCPALPQGRIVVFTSKEIFEDGPWSFPHDKLPLVKFGSYPIPNSPYDAGEIEDAIPVQKELNKKLSQILTHADQTINPKWTSPRGAVQTFSLADPVIQYSPINGMKPEPVTHQPLPQYMGDILKDMNARISAFFMLTDVSQGAPAGGDNAGISVELQQEASTDSIAPIVDDNERSVSKAFYQCLSLARKFYTFERLLPITGENGKGQIVAFQGQRVPDNVLLKVEPQSSLPRTKAGRTQRVLLLHSMGLLPKGQEYKYLDMPDLKGWKQQAMLDEDQADREHDKIKAGEPINPVAMMAAQGALQSGINPDTQQPFLDNAEAQAFILKAMLQPLSYENSQAHLATHTTYMKTVEFESLPPDVQHEFIQHVELTQGKITAENPAPSQVKVNMAAHEVLPPSAVSAILNEAGVQGITPEMLRDEPPMESMNMVTDSLDKPNADTAQYKKEQAAKPKASSAPNSN